MDKHQLNSNRGIFLISAVMGAALIMSLVFCSSVCAEPLSSLQVVINGQSLDFGDAPPFVEDDRSYVGVRCLALGLGVPEAGIGWNESAQKVTLQKGSTSLILTIDNPVMIVNGGQFFMDVAPVLRNDRTYLPARWVAEALGYNVVWDETQQAVLITGPSAPPAENDNQPPSDELTLESSTFSRGSAIPNRCAAPYAGGHNLSPHIQWSGGPDTAQSFALIMYDRDAQNWLHWAVLNIPAGTGSLREGASSSTMPTGCLELPNETYQQKGYIGPGPPAGSGVHHYIIVVYALDVQELPATADFQDFTQIQAILGGHIVAQGQYEGTYER